jgi:hypothetical protein
MRSSSQTLHRNLSTQRQQQQCRRSSKQRGTQQVICFSSSINSSNNTSSSSSLRPSRWQFHQLLPSWARCSHSSSSSSRTWSPLLVLEAQLQGMAASRKQAAHRISSAQVAIHRLAGKQPPLTSNYSSSSSSSSRTRQSLPSHLVCLQRRLYSTTTTTSSSSSSRRPPNHRQQPSQHPHPLCRQLVQVAGLVGAAAAAAVAMAAAKARGRRAALQQQHQVRQLEQAVAASSNNLRPAAQALPLLRQV